MVEPALKVVKQLDGDRRVGAAQMAVVPFVNVSDEVRALFLIGPGVGEAADFHDLRLPEEVELDKGDETVEELLERLRVRPVPQFLLQPADMAGENPVVGIQQGHPDTHRLGPLAIRHRHRSPPGSDPRARSQAARRVRSPAVASAAASLEERYGMPRRVLEWATP